MCTGMSGVFVNVCVSGEDFYVSLIKSLSLSLLRLCHSLLHSCVSLAGHKHTYTHTSSKVDNRHNGHISSQGSASPFCLSLSHTLPRLNYAITASGLDAEYQ